MSVIPWGRFNFIGYVIAVSLAFSVLLLDSLIFFCTTCGLLPIFVRSWTQKIRTYSVLMTVLGIMFFVFGIATILDVHTEKGIKNFLETKWRDREIIGIGETGDLFWDNVQTEYLCCGLTSARDYFHTVPDSCCANVLKPCSIDKAYGIGCYSAVKKHYEQILVTLLATISFILSFVCLMLVTLAQFSKKIFRLHKSFENDNTSAQ